MEGLVKGRVVWLLWVILMQTLQGNVFTRKHKFSHCIWDTVSLLGYIFFLWVRWILDEINCLFLKVDSKRNICV